MKKYLLDTDILIFLFRQKHGIAEIIAHLHPSQVYVSEVSIAELEYGCWCSGRYEENKMMLEKFISQVNIVPFHEAIPLYAREKYRLRSIGQSIMDFDLLIGCTSVAKGLIMITNNESHLGRIKDIKIENWIK